MNAESISLRQQAYLDLLQRSLVMLRNYATESNIELCQIEADHLHEIPTYIFADNECRHNYYIRSERSLYLQRLIQLGATEYLDQIRIWYAEPWQVLAIAANIEIDG